MTSLPRPLRLHGRAHSELEVTQGGLNPSGCCALPSLSSHLPPAPPYPRSAAPPRGQSLGEDHQEKGRLLTFYRSSAVNYLSGGSHVHKLLPLSGSNIVFPCASSSVSLSLIQYNQDSSVECIPLIAAGNNSGAGGGACELAGCGLVQGGGVKYRRKLFQRRPATTEQASAETSISHKEEEFPGRQDGSQTRDSTPRLSRDLTPIRVTAVDPHYASHPSSSSGAPRLKINVSGQLFETRLWVLDRHPETLLGDRRKRSQFFDRGRDELFFDRHRPSFEAIFVYYQCGGRLRRPHHVPDDVFLDELVFYQLESEAVEEYKRSQGYTAQTVPLPSNSALKRLWILFEFPETSRAAFAVAILSVLMTLVSIVLFCVETLPVYAESHCVSGEMPNFLDPFFVIETICTAWFTLEAIARFVACPDKLAFWRDFKNIVDVLAIMPYYITLFNVLASMSCEGAKSSASLAFLRVIRLVRIFKLTKHSIGLQVLILTFQASLEGLGLFLVALCVCLLLFSSTIYYAELGVPGSQIHSIPDAFWWAIITMTTVGYGDKVPVGFWGKLVGAACAITGVLTLAIPVPIITGHFNRFYAHKTGRGRHI